MKIFSCLLSSASAVLAVGLLTSCASSNPWLEQTDSALPIEVIHGGSGRLLSSRAHETSGRLYVAGSAKEHPLMRRAHIDIQLLDAGGNVLAERQEDIDAAHPAPGGGRRLQDAYVASFPLSDARQAAKIRVFYHDAPHTQS